mmetsp:Transcript_21392/g.39933  ORF Transcript_21392/g.39933 Transcript_21392/m.39933 type:complete len:215 (+) Transcript_21392:181-825(+)
MFTLRRSHVEHLIKLRIRYLKTIQHPTTFQTVVKNSKFIAHAQCISSKEDAQGFIEAVKDMKATHNCYAYKINDIERANDDGEVAGTAGKQILAVINRSHLDHVAVVVTRFYGGIKLGTGGLTRAYTGAASGCLQLATVVPWIPTCTVDCSLLLSALGSFYHFLNHTEGAEIVTEEFGSNTVTMRVKLPEDRRARFVDAFNAQYTRNSEGEIKN